MSFIIYFHSMNLSAQRMPFSIKELPSATLLQKTLHGFCHSLPARHTSPLNLSDRTAKWAHKAMRGIVTALEFEVVFSS